MSRLPGWMPWLLPPAAVVAVALVLLPRQEAPPPLPPVLSVEQMRSLPDAGLISAVTTDLRIRLTAAGATSGRWRAWPESARHVLAWSCVEADNGPMAPRRFEGLAAILANRGRELPGHADIAAAYQALGAERPAMVVLEASAIASDGDAAVVGNRFAVLDQRFLQALGRDGTVMAMRTYIRSHIAELADVR